ncbi:MAG: fibronectin type III domain-containing protein [Candidatus Niyogibacteria bacterium]|nr:fibronectin type III domain-containing protein [Candidatus Niyogibacteria bacterium]
MKTWFDIEKFLGRARPQPLNADEKERLWSRIEPALTPRRAASSWKFLFGVPYYQAALAALLIFLLGGGAAFAAADSAGPGDMLYPLDIASEKIRIVFSSTQKKDELKVKFAEERLEEAQKIVSTVLIRVKQTHTASSTVAASSTPASASTSTPPAASGNGTSTLSSADSKKLEKAEAALAETLARLTVTKAELEAKGNSVAAVALGNIIARLNQLTDERLAQFDAVKIKVRDSGNGMKIELAFSSDSKSELKFEKKGNEKSRGADKKENEEHKKDTDEKTAVKVKIGQDDEDEDENDDRNGEGKVTICHIPPGNHKNPRTMTIARSAEKAHVAHGDTQGPCSSGGGTATTTPPVSDVMPPAISQVASSAVASTSAAISWTTNEPATGKTYYATSSPLILSSAFQIATTSLLTAHSANLTDLAASTTYYYIVESADAVGNRATSTEHNFQTLP